MSKDVAISRGYLKNWGHWGPLFLTNTPSPTWVTTLNLIASGKTVRAYITYGDLLEQEAQLMLTTGSTRLAVSRGQQTWYHSTCYIWFPIVQ